MMPSLYTVTLPGQASTYVTDVYHDDVSRQMAISQAARRLSRGSNGQRAGAAMRIVKPSSANNSPRSSMLGRRKTLMNDGNLARRRQQVLDQVALPVPTDSAARSSRPVSWHPSSRLQQPHPVTQSASQYPFPASAFNDVELAPYPRFPPPPASYSCNTSPSSVFSPLTLSYNSFEAPTYSPWSLNAPAVPGYIATASDSGNPFTDSFPPHRTGSGSPPSLSALDWNSFVLHGFDSTSPPTPEALPPPPHAQPALPAEDSIPYQSLEEPEEEGEILVGMGLYDAPSKYDSDPQLDIYRSTVSSLLGNAYRPQATGKGLKLEESWQPPPESDDEDEDDADDRDEPKQETTSKSWI